MAVTVQLRGGLGNQLFQYAAGYALSVRLGTNLVVDTVLLPESTIDRGGVRRWPEQISSFDHKGIITSTPISTARKRITQSLAGFERSVGDSRARELLGSRIYARETFDDVAAFDRLTDGARINAYCNSPSFFREQQIAIADQIRSLTAPGEWYLSMASEMENVKPIALHVRWGDYLNLQHVYGSIGADYYARALVHVQRVVGDRPVWLFSDDPAGASTFLSPKIALDRVIDSPGESTPLENLRLLSQAAGIACANSSFSWWAAYLSHVPHGGIVFPRPLFGLGGPPEPKDWLHDEWIQVGRD